MFHLDLLCLLNFEPYDCVTFLFDSMDMSLSKAPRDGEGQGSLACHSPWGRKESGATEQQQSAKCGRSTGVCGWVPQDNLPLPSSHARAAVLEGRRVLPPSRQKQCLQNTCLQKSNSCSECLALEMTAFAEEGDTGQRGEVGYLHIPCLHFQFSPWPPGSIPSPASVASVWGTQDAPVKVSLSCYSWGVVRKEGVGKVASARLLAGFCCREVVREQRMGKSAALPFSLSLSSRL